VSGVCPDGLRTTVFPVASADARRGDHHRVVEREQDSEHVEREAAGVGVILAAKGTTEPRSASSAAL
jgi:hypothetical protein